MFKTAPNYLSGVSVFMGDDITRREQTGDVVFFVGPSTKGPAAPVDLGSIDNIVGIFGNDNPLTKAAYEFYDGFLDSKQSVNLRPVAMRIGGIQAKVTTSFGIVITTADAYDGIENDFYLYINNSEDETLRSIKIWDKNKRLVYRQKWNTNKLTSVVEVDSGAVTVEGTLAGSTNKFYGKDLDTNPSLVPMTLWDAMVGGYPTGADSSGDEIASGSLVYAYNLAEGDTTITIEPIVLDTPRTLAGWPRSGVCKLADTASVPGGVWVTNFEVLSYANGTISIDPPLPFDVADCHLHVIGSTLIQGDSQLNLDNRQLYEKFRNALLEVETYTPDYLVPAGVTFDAKYHYDYTQTLETVTTAAISNTDEFVYVEGAVAWPSEGMVKINDADDLHYQDKIYEDGQYKLVISPVKVQIVSGSITGGTPKIIKIKMSSNTPLAIPEWLGEEGALQFDEARTIINYTVASIDSITYPYTVITLNTTSAVPVGSLTGLYLTKIPKGYTVGKPAVTTFIESIPFECGIGYVKETLSNGEYSFDWSDTKYVATTGTNFEAYNLAHFGYLFAKFCNDATVGYNTPLCAMNVSTPTNVNSRASIAEWIGTFPTFTYYGGDLTKPYYIEANGTGLLGDSVLVGSMGDADNGVLNRTAFTDELNNEFSDPAFGMLLTDEGFIDGGVIYDTYNKVVDLGKFMMVGAGLLTFSNRAKNVPYIDTMGIYALGMLAGAPKNEGISFSRIGTNSNASITTIINRSVYNDLVRAGYVVPTREKALGWVINNDNSACRSDSGYFLISTTRTIKEVLERKRSILVGFIGKPMNRFYLEAAKTKVADSFAFDVTSGYLNGYRFTLDTVDAGVAIGKLLLKTSLNPPLELVQVDIDAVIDRNVVTTGT